MENKRYRTRNRKKAWKLSLLRNFDRLTRRQIREIAEDYRNYLTHYLRLHLSKEDFDMLVSTPYMSRKTVTIIMKCWKKFVMRLNISVHIIVPVFSLEIDLNI